MYTNLFYYIIYFMILGFIFRLIGPFIIPMLIAYLIYTFIKHRHTIKTMRDLNKAKKTFEKEWEDVTQSQEYQSRPNDDVIEADYTIKEE